MSPTGETPLTWREHLRTVAVLTAGILLLMLGFPGVSFMKSGKYKRPIERKEAQERLGAFAPIAFELADFNRDVRLPIERKVGVIQRPFRVSQTFHLYRDGPQKVRRLEVWADDELLHRSGDDDATWREGQLRNRRFRPVVESNARKVDGRNGESMVRWLLAEVLEERPTTERLEVRAAWADYPGDGETWRHHGWYAEAPHWTVYRLRGEPKP